MFLTKQYIMGFKHTVYLFCMLFEKGNDSKIILYDRFTSHFSLKKRQASLKKIHF